MATATLSDINAQIKAHEEEISRLKAAAEAQRKEEVAAVVQDLRTKIAEYGITAAELGLGRGKGKVRRRSTLAEAVGKGQQYRGPNGETWYAGTRGRKPRWLADELAKGKGLADLAV